MKSLEINWKLNSYCEYNCEYCHGKWSSGSLDKTLDQYLDVIEKLQTTRYPYGDRIKWVLSGGEPLHFPNLNQILQKIKEKNSYVRLDTSGGDSWFGVMEIIEYVDYLGNRSKTVSEVKEFNIGATPLILNQVFADTVVSNTQYASASIVTGSLQVTGSVYYQNRKQYNFGQFYDTTTQSGSRNTPYAMKLNTTDISEGVSITNNGSGLPTRITVSNTGYYNLQFGFATMVLMWPIQQLMLRLLRDLE